MVCKFCNAEIGENHRYCPECGKRQDIEAENTAGTPEKMPKKELWKPILLITSFVAVIGILTVILLNQFGVSLLPKEDIFRKDTYAVKEEKAVKKADTVVATFCDKTLDNALLQVFYVEALQSFLTEYYDYLSQLGLDTTKSLSDQTSYFDKTMTWEQLLLQDGLESWQSYVMMGKLADEAGFTLDEYWQKLLDEMPESLEEDAKSNNYESADAMLKDRYGESCTMETYMEYANLVLKANAYYSSNFDITDEQIEATFAQYEAKFAEKGITKTSALVSDVRHILIEPEGGTDAGNGKKTYTEQEWAACLSKAEQVLGEWKSGKADEDSFKELVTKYTADTASKSTGGLYEGILNDGTYMKEFQDWAINTSRTTGETGIVKTDYGYHIMYFVKGEPEWIYYSRTQAANDRYTQMQSKMKAILEETPAQIKYSKIVLFEPYL